jgi:hypothetical protein
MSKHVRESAAPSQGRDADRAKPRRITCGFTPKPSKVVPLKQIARDDGSSTSEARSGGTHHSGLEGENYIILEIRPAPDAGSSASEILLRVGRSSRSTCSAGANISG